MIERDSVAILVKFLLTFLELFALLLQKFFRVLDGVFVTDICCDIFANYIHVHNASTNIMREHSKSLILRSPPPYDADKNNTGD